MASDPCRKLKVEAMGSDYEIVSDRAARQRRSKEAKKAAAAPVVAVKDDGSGSETEERKKKQQASGSEVALDPEAVSSSAVAQASLEIELGAKEREKNAVVEIEVVRVCPNPRLIVGRYQDGEGVERQVKVRVGVNKNYRPRMRFMVERPLDWESRLLPWEYRGRRPRRAGRW